MKTPPSFDSASPRVARAVMVALGLACVPVTHATLYVYEGFAGYTSGALAGQFPNGNTTGLDQTVAYYDGGGSRTAGYTVQSAGLTFGSLTTSGGSLAFSSASTNVIGPDISQTAISGTLWSSYLVTFTSMGTGFGNGAVIRIGSTPADSTGAHFNSWSDSRNGTSNTVATGYGNGSNQSDGNAVLALNTTYIIISRYTNVGAGLSVSTPGVATLWALNESQFTSLLAAGGTETALQSASVTATAMQSTTSGVFTFNSNTSIGIVTVSDGGAFDEFRYGSTLSDVIPVPEPAATVLLCGLGCGLLALGRRPRSRTAPDRQA